MDSGSFDRPAKRIAGAHSRRGSLKGLGNGMAAAIGIGGPLGSVILSRD
jgi:hypothetical protein